MPHCVNAQAWVKVHNWLFPDAGPGQLIIQAPPSLLLRAFGRREAGEFAVYCGCCLAMLSLQLLFALVWAM